MFLLFTITWYWLYFSYGAPLELTAQVGALYDNFIEIGFVVVLGILLVILVIRNSRKQSVLLWIRMAIAGTITIMVLIELIAIFQNQIFTHYWVWAFDSILELDYLFPYSVPIIFLLGLLGTLLEAINLIDVGTDQHGQIGLIVVRSYVLLGILEEIMATQPLWITYSLLFGLAIIGIAIQIFSASLGITIISPTPVVEKPKSLQEIVRFIFIILGFFGLGAVEHLFQGQIQRVTRLFPVMDRKLLRSQQPSY